MDQQLNPQLYSDEAERQVLGICLVNTQRLEETDLDPSEFWSERHRDIYAVIRKIHGSGMTPDYLTVGEYFRRDSKPDITRYLDNLVLESGIGVNVENLTRIVRDYAARRRILENASELAKAAYDLAHPISEPVGRVIDALAVGASVKDEAAHWGNALDEFYDFLVERSKNPTDVWGLPTGFIDIDKLTGGMQLKELVYFAGEPGVGKSILLDQIGVQMAIAGHPGAIYSLEMGMRQVIMRIVSGLAKVRTRAMKQGRLETEDWDKIIKVIQDGHSLPLHISDTSSITTSGLRAQLAKLKAKNGIEWAAVDYDMLLADGEGKLDDTAFTTLVSGRLKGIAKDLNIALLSVSSVTKDAIGDDGAPTMRGAKGGAQKLHNADVIAFLTKEQSKNGWAVANDSIRVLSFVKGRELERLGTVNLMKFNDYPLFADATVTTIKL